jgi:hypothetical protein
MASDLVVKKAGQTTYSPFAVARLQVPGALAARPESRRDGADTWPSCPLQPGGRSRLRTFLRVDSLGEAFLERSS